MRRLVFRRHDIALKYLVPGAHAAPILAVEKRLPPSNAATACEVLRLQAEQSDIASLNDAYAKMQQIVTSELPSTP